MAERIGPSVGRQETVIARPDCMLPARIAKAKSTSSRTNWNTQNGYINEEIGELISKQKLGSIDAITGEEDFGPKGFNWVALKGNDERRDDKPYYTYGCHQHDRAPERSVYLEDGIVEPENAQFDTSNNATKDELFKPSGLW
ncbi:hypothetical protein NPX13_g10250 [Xylaria arbuscula]|uniref:Uncharacterized protein n=1 Tax=Xylaria arbuscula TaxID=114810 RepID=A0A9W8THN4_9PEZI|nr:hypothetical protein NPX13_g10250 [Xylaria arbuscula]